MTMPRALILSPGESVYHCISRCVRRAYLCGDDALTGKNFDYRKDWVHERLIFLSSIFTIDVLGYALMSTHSHKMLRTRPDLLEELKDSEVVKRWFKLYPKRAIVPGSEQYKNLVELTVSDKKRVKTLRARLVSVSWFMKSLNEHIARKANKEDDCKGRFWEGRFKCQRLCDQAAVLSCSVYIDLNPIRAKIAKTPEESKFTGAFERINGIKKLSKEAVKKGKEPQSWLAPIQDTAQRRGFLKVTLPEYLSILDITGREIRHGKRGSIPSELSPILERIGINPEHWLSTCQSCRRSFGSAIGSGKSLRTLASKLGRSWLKGVKLAETAFA